VVRNIALWQFRPGTTQEQVDALVSAIRAMPIQGADSEGWWRHY